MTNEKTEFKVKGEDLIKKIKQLIHEGNIRRIIIKDDKGHVYIEIPLTVGIVGTALIPIWAAVGAIADPFAIIVSGVSTSPNLCER